MKMWVMMRSTTAILFHLAKKNLREVKKAKNQAASRNERDQQSLEKHKRDLY